MDDFSKIFEQVNKFGGPTVFIIGLLRGWWVIRPHAEMLITRIKELTDDVRAAKAVTTRATDLTEDSNQIAIEALTVARETARKVDVIYGSLIGRHGEEGI